MAISPPAEERARIMHFLFGYGNRHWDSLLSTCVAARAVKYDDNTDVKNNDKAPTVTEDPSRHSVTIESERHAHGPLLDTKNQTLEA